MFSHYINVSLDGISRYGLSQNIYIVRLFSLFYAIKFPISPVKNNLIIIPGQELRKYALIIKVKIIPVHE